jgi:hypothetical protein
MAVAAHPDSPRPALQWTDWSAPLDGLEWLNADSEWRDEFLGSLGRYLLTYRLRPAETLTAALDRPATALDRWDQVTLHRRVVGLAGADAHARLGFRQQTDPYEEGWHLRVPSYEASFRTFGIRVQLPVPLGGDAAADAENVLTHLRLGRVYTVIDGLATPGAFEFTATSGDRRSDIGGYLDIRGEVVLHVLQAAPEGSRLMVLRNGQAFFEIHAPGAMGQPPIPWLVSNPIYVGMRDAHAAAARPAPLVAVARRASIATDLWGAEASAMSISMLRPPSVPDGVAGLEWQYQLAGGAPSGQYAAVRFPVEGLVGFDRLQLRARADHPVRVWLQLRASTVGDGERWGRTLYLDQEYRSIELGLDALGPLGATSTPTPPLDKIDVVLMVVDTVNTRPGTAGVVQLAELWLAAR